MFSCVSPAPQMHGAGQGTLSGSESAPKGLCFSFSPQGLSVTLETLSFLSGSSWLFLAPRTSGFSGGPSGVPLGLAQTHLPPESSLCLAKLKVGAPTLVLCFYIIVPVFSLCAC